MQSKLFTRAICIRFMACTVHSFTPAIFMCAELLRGDRSVLQGYSHNVSVMRTSAIKCKGHATRGGSCKWDAAAGAGIILTGRWGWAGQRLGKHAHAKALPLATPIGVDGKRRGAVAVVAVVAGAVGAAGAAGADGSDGAVIPGVFGRTNLGNLVDMEFNGRNIVLNFSNRSVTCAVTHSLV